MAGSGIIMGMYDIYKSNPRLFRPKTQLELELELKVEELAKQNDELIDELRKAEEDCYKLASGYGEWYALIEYIEAINDTVINNSKPFGESGLAKAYDTAELIKSHIRMFKEHGTKFFTDLNAYKDMNAE